MYQFLSFAGSIDFSDPYVMIIIAGGVIVLSYLYNYIANKTNIPSVLLLILTGIGMQKGLESIGIPKVDLSAELELLGIIGLIMIVLEAALDLELNKKKLPLIGKSLLVAFVCLIASTFLIAWIIQLFIEMNYIKGLLYATPLSIMSSAIIIPSVTGLIGLKKEFMVYEGAFSDIVGIMLFYFLLSFIDSGGKVAVINFTGGLLITFAVAILSSYILIFIFKDIKGHIRLFLLISVLLILYSLGKLLHLSPLIIILIFGLGLANHNLFYRLFKDDNTNKENDPIEKIEKEFKLITLETSFVVRTFFFVVFGMAIDLNSLLNFEVFWISMLILCALYLIRFVVLRMTMGKDIFPELWIAPRGLITILLFYAIPVALQVDYFDNAILLYVIIFSSMIMSVALIRDKGKNVSVSSRKK